MMTDLLNDDISNYEEKIGIRSMTLKSQLDTTFNLIKPMANSNQIKSTVTYNAYDIPGLYYIKNYLDQPEIDAIMNKIQFEIKFEPISKTINSRRVSHFGYYYSYDKSGVTPADPIPDYLDVLVDKNRINNICGENIICNSFDQLIINQYKPQQQIAPHIDHVEQFGPIIACITVGKSVPIIFSLESTKKIINVETGSMYIMTGDSRYSWKHSLKNTSDGNRYSLTYRTICK
jgi:alkylated DNA repair dioxygenase AlkB